MIFTERTVTIRSGASSMDEKVILYRGDSKIEIRFTIKDSKFKFQKAGNIISNTNAAYAQLAILNPNGSNTFTEITPTDNGTVLFEISGEMIDELEEVGLYSFHIRLFDEENESRITLPAVIDGIEIREPVIIESDPIVGTVNEDNTITIYDTLESGIYTLKYEFKDGTQEELAELAVFDASEFTLNQRYSSSQGGMVELLGVISINPSVEPNTTYKLTYRGSETDITTGYDTLYLVSSDGVTSVVNESQNIRLMTQGVVYNEDNTGVEVTFTTEADTVSIWFSVLFNPAGTSIVSTDELTDVVLALEKI